MSEHITAGGLKGETDLQLPRKLRLHAVTLGQPGIAARQQHTQGRIEASAGNRCRQQRRQHQGQCQQRIALLHQKAGESVHEEVLARAQCVSE